jgi:hypothetical protein
VHPLLLAALSLLPIVCVAILLIVTRVPLFRLDGWLKQVVLGFHDIFGTSIRHDCGCCTCRERSLSWFP